VQDDRPDPLITAEPEPEPTTSPDQRADSDTAVDAHSAVDADSAAGSDTAASSDTAVDTDTASHTETDSPPKVFSLRFSVPGLVVALLFFGLSLSPSLLPRTGLFQGIVSGITAVIGYAFGVTGAWLWSYLGIPRATRATTVGRVVLLAPVVLVALLTALSVWRQVGWQNDVRELFDMAPTSPTVWLTIIVVTVLVGALLLIIGRSVRRLFRLVVGWGERVLPRRVARVVGAVVVTVLLWTLVSGVLVDGFFALANQSFSVRDAVTPDGLTQPSSALRSGSPESLVEWDSLGRQGKRFVATGATVEELDEANGGGALEPIRVYASIDSADDLDGRAQLVLDELIRTNAFDRQVLVIATTTGTGFLEPNAVNSLEYLHNGDTAIVGVQYSYLPSWISLLADQEVTRETSRVVFDTIHTYWSTLPDDSRPDLYLFGLSLGSFGVESILTSINVLNEPIDGALMVGPPFVNPLWTQLMADRDPGSPAWLPVYEDGRTVRFTSLEDRLEVPTGVWGETKLVYLQHNSDPVSFFSGDLALSSPAWLADGQRGPDVSPEMGWFPLVTMWQVALDLPVAGNVPAGHGHLYTSGEYLSGWIGITEPEGWSDEDFERLEPILAERERTLDE
jgi:uncharacterized membrane protein